MEKLTDGTLSIMVSEHGAELCSIVKDGTEYLWQADPAYWKRHSPVLFPIVGSLWNGVFRYDGKEYPMSQHGFARDMDFSLERKSDREISYRLDSDGDTLEKYPFRFSLEIGYRLEDGNIRVIWRVSNTDDRTMYYQIGAHPAFYYPDFRPETRDRGFFSFEGGSASGGRGKAVEDLDYILIKEKSCADPDTVHHIHLDEGLLPVDTGTFAADALIIQDAQVGKVVLHAPDRRPWLALSFDAPVVGLWSPPGKNAPFVCIEPWYGRCDRAGYEGDISGRDWIQSLGAGESAEMSYLIEIY